MKNTELIRQRIQKIVIMSGLSKAKFANSIGFDKNNLSLILNGKRGVPESLIVAIVRGQYATFEELMYGENDTKSVQKSFSDMSNSGGGDMTINNGASEVQSQRADAITNKILDMLARGIDNILAVHSRLENHDKTENANMAIIAQRLDERNRLADQLIDMLDVKDEQLKEKDIQIRMLTELLAAKIKE